MDECEGVKKLIAVEDKGGDGNGTLRTSDRGRSGTPPTMRFSAKDINGVSPRSAGGGGSGAPKTMDECEDGNEGGNGATSPRRDPFINPYEKYSILDVVRNSGGERGHGRYSKGGNSRGHGRNRKCSGENFNSKNNGPSKTGRGYFMHTFGISVIVADVGR